MVERALKKMTKKHKDQLKSMFAKFCERSDLNPKDKDVMKAFRFGYRAGHRVARIRAINDELQR